MILPRRDISRGDPRCRRLQRLSVDICVLRVCQLRTCVILIKHGPSTYHPPDPLGHENPEDIRLFHVAG